MSGNMKKYDLIVCGGGMAGVAAAVAAAREGLSALIIEQYGFLGGMACAGLVNPFMLYCTKRGEGENFDWSKPVNAGIFAEIVNRLQEMGGLHSNRMTFNEELLKIVLDRLTREKGIEVLFHSFLTSVQVRKDKVTAVKVVHKGGETTLKARYFIDATGDGDVVRKSGCSYHTGDADTGRHQPATLCFRIGNVDTEVYAPVWGWYDGSYRADSDQCRDMVNRCFARLKAQGKIKTQIPFVSTFAYITPGVIHFNSTRVADMLPTDIQAFSRAEMEAREQMYELFCFMKEHVPGFAHSYLMMSAAQIGIRESTHIVGEYTIDREDILRCRKFPDAIARGSYGIDIHHPSGDGTTQVDVAFGDYYTIPYRALVPDKVSNLLVVGRPISATHEAHSALRVLPICTCIGEGAGTAVALAARENLACRQVEPEALRRRLTEHGGLC